MFSHHAPKDSEQGIKCLLLAENDEQVYNWIASEPEINEEKLYNSWKEKDSYTWDEEDGLFVNEELGEAIDEGWWDEDGNPENFKDRMLRLKGEINDESADFSDSYYGITLLGWELLKENVTIDYLELIELGIVFNVSNK